MNYITSLLLPLSLAFSTLAVAKPLQVWIMPNGANPQGILEERLTEFRQETGLEAQVVVLDWGEAWSRINTALETGQGPDVLQLGTTWVSYFASQGRLASLNAHKTSIEPSRFMETSFKTCMVDGDTNIYSIPWFVDVRVLMGNRRILDSMKIDGKQLATWSDYHRTLAKLRAAGLAHADGTPIHPYAFPGKSDWNIPHNFAPWIWSEGGDFINKQDGQWRSRLLEKATVVGIRKYLGFVFDTLMNVSSLRDNTAQVAQRFNNSEQVFILNTSEIIMQTRIPESEGGLQGSRIGLDGVRTFPVPAGPGGSVSFVGGSNLALPKAKAKDPNAMRLLLFLTRPDNLDRYTSRIGFIPPDRGVLQVWAQDSLYRVLVQQAESGRAYPNIPSWGQIEGMLIEMFSSVWSMMDVGGFYSDQELYNLLVDYDGRINKVLGAQSGAIPTFEQFALMVANVQPEPETQPDTAVVAVPVTDRYTRGQIGLALFALLAIIGLVLVAFRKRKGA